MNLSLRNSFFVAALVAGLFLLFMSRYSWLPWLGLRGSESLGSVQKVEGVSATIQESGQLGRHPLTEGTSIGSGDLIEVGPSTTADIAFKNGHTVSLSENSRIVIELLSDKIPPLLTIQVFDGTVTSIQESQSSPLQITSPKGTVQLGLKTAVEVEPAVPVVTPETDVNSPDKAADLGNQTKASNNLKAETDKGETPKTQQPSAAATKTAVVDQYIENVIKGQKPILHRCYEELLKRQPETKGSMELSFQILTTGSVQRVSVVSSKISDPEFQGCVRSVFERLKFKSFTGEPLIVTYPLQFE